MSHMQHSFHGLVKRCFTSFNNMLVLRSCNVLLLRTVSCSGALALWPESGSTELAIDPKHDCPCTLQGGGQQLELFLTIINSSAQLAVAVSRQQVGGRLQRMFMPPVLAHLHAGYLFDRLS